MQEDNINDTTVSGTDGATDQGRVENRRREILGKLALGAFVVPASLGMLARKRAFVSV